MTYTRHQRAREQMQRVEDQRSRVNFQRRAVDPHDHRCEPETIDYGTTSHSCQVCGRTWTISISDKGNRVTCFPITHRMPAA